MKHLSLVCGSTSREIKLMFGNNKATKTTDLALPLLPVLPNFLESGRKNLICTKLRAAAGLVQTGLQSAGTVHAHENLARDRSPN